MSDSDRTIVPTPDQLRGISHPVRLRLLGLLRMDGPQTSAELARATGLNTGATSYHLRQLALHGFIEDEPGRGTGRERHWRARHRGTRTARPGEAPGPTAGLDDLAGFQQLVVTWAGGQIQAAQDEWTELPEPWRAATTFSDYLLRLDADQAARVIERFHAVLAEVSEEFPYEIDEAEVQSADEDGRELYEIHLLAFPVPGRIPHRDGE